MPAQALAGDGDAGEDEKRGMVSHVSSSGLSSGQSVAFRGMSFLPLACVPFTWTVLPAHLPRSSSCSALGPCVRSPTQVCLRRAAVSVLAAMWCGSISDHSSFSVSPYFPVSDSRQGAWDCMCDQQLGDSYYSCETVCPGGIMVTGMHVVPGCIRVTGLLRSLIHLARWGWLSD